MRNGSDSSCRENKNIRFMFSNSPPPESRAVHDIVEAVRPQMIVWRMHVACWISKAASTH